jgi:hypothetical protein
MRRYTEKLLKFCDPCQDDCAVQVQLGETGFAGAKTVEEISGGILPIQVSDFADTILKLRSVEKSAMIQAVASVRAVISSRAATPAERAAQIHVIEELSALLKLPSSLGVLNSSEEDTKSAALSGSWSGLHMTLDEQGRVEISHHNYHLTVMKCEDGKSEYVFEGTHTEKRRPEHPPYEVSGRINKDEIELKARHDNEASVGLLKLNYNMQRMTGMYLVHDWSDDKNLISSLIVLWKGKDDTKSINKLLREMKKECSSRAHYIEVEIP